MNVVIRVDSSASIGTGHLIRCLTLGEALRKKSVQLSFISRELPGNLNVLIRKRDFKVWQLPLPDLSGESAVKKSDRSYFSGTSWEEDVEKTLSVLSECKMPDWLIVDHYGLDKRWEEQMRPAVKKIMVIDDLADRLHDCDVLLDQNLHEAPETRYEKLVPPQCRKFLGPRFALLRSEFIEARKRLRKRDGNIRRILVFLGGTDPTNETEKVLRAINLMNRKDIAVDVVVGSANARKDEIKWMCEARPNFSYYCQVDNMADLMLRADLSIGAGGSTTWERCYLGLPTITLIVSSNQEEITKEVASLCAAWNAGRSEEVTPDHLAGTIQAVMEDPVSVREVGERALQLMGEAGSESAQGLLIQTILEGSNATA